jgi:hypothetical protein
MVTKCSTNKKNFSGFESENVKERNQLRDPGMEEDYIYFEETDCVN